MNTNDIWLIAGLGNPEPKYDGTRHNCGFLAIDRVAETLQVKIDRVKFRGLTAMATYAGQKLCLLKPETFMNLSGDSVLQASAFFKIPPERIVVMFDDISLSPGRLRVRGDGSAGGHNGIKNIIAHLGTQEFPRIKIGTGAPAGGGAEMIDWVIGVPSQAERKILVDSFERAVKAAADILENGCQKAMNDYN